MSSGFSFGAKSTPAPVFGATGGSITFGTPVVQPQPQQQQQFGFGGLPTSTPSLFGTPAPQTTSALGFKPTGFGAPMAAAPGGAFGASSGFGGGATPGFGLQSSGAGFGMGATAPAASAAPGTGFGFGAPAGAATGLSFGTPASSAPASTGLSFGAPATAGLSFGTPASTGLPFGTPASTAASGLAFGTPASTGLSFGAPTTSTGLSFGAPATTAPATGLSFGATSVQPTTGLSFGAPTSTGLGFGTPATSVPSFGLPASTATTGLSFGLGTTPTLSLTSKAPTAAVAPTPSFGFAPTATTISGFGLGGLSNSVPSSTNLGVSVTPATATTTQPQSVGLGGIASSFKSGTSSTQKEVPPKEQPLPNEFLQTVEHFKNFVQEEKNRSSEVARCSVNEYRRVGNELEFRNQEFIQLESQLNASRSVAEQLKFETAKGLQNIEMAQRTQETPPGLQYENTAPIKYFLDLADNFEKDMQALKLKIDNTEKFVKKWNEPGAITSQDLGQGMRKLHETFVALAGRMQTFHNQVESNKERFLSIRKQTIKDNINPFDVTTKNVQAINAIMRQAVKTPPKLAAGPTPFSNVITSNTLVLAMQQNPPAYPNAPSGAATTTHAWGPTPNFGAGAATSSMFKPTGFGASSGLGAGLGTSSLFGSTNASFGSQGTGFGAIGTGFGSTNTGFGATPSFGSQPLQAQAPPFQNTSSFQLQKPPTGNKRGKQ